MATGGSEDTSDELFQFKCSSCVKVNRNREAVSYCVECQGYCCQSCADTHKLFPATESHNLLDKSSFKSSVLTADLPEVPTERCSIHTIKIQDMYCEDHDVVCCTTCMALDHRSCIHVKSVPDVIDAIFQQSDVDKMYQDLQDKKAMMTKLKETRQDCIRELTKSKAEAVDAIKNFRKDMECVLANLETESIKELENEFKKMESNLKEESKNAGDKEDAIQRAACNLKSLEGNRAQQFVCMKNAQNKFDEVTTKSPSFEAPLLSTLTFTKNKKMIDFIKGLKTLGNVCSQSMNSLIPKTTLYSVERSTEMNIKFKDDKNTCNVHGCCLTQDGMVLLADNTNDSLKRLDPVKMTEVDQCRLGSAPWSVCCTSKEEAAVSLYNKTIQFVSLGTRMALKHQLKLDHKCFGIAYNNEELYISDDDKTLYTYDMKGNLMQKISHDSLKKGRNVSCSYNNDRVFVCDWYKGLVALGIHGKHINTCTFSDKDLSVAHGVCTDKRGNVFVCGFGSHNVIQIAEDGKTKIGVVVNISNDVSRPLSVCFDLQRSLLIVTQCGNDKIKLFFLK